MREEKRVYISKSNCISPLGFSLKEHEMGILSGKTAISRISESEFSKEAFYGAIMDTNRIEKAFKYLPYSGNYSKLEKMMLLAIHPILSKISSQNIDKIGLILSTTKGNIDKLGDDEKGYYLAPLAKKIAISIGIENEPIVISNACVSGIMAVSVARRLILLGEYDHILIVAGDVFSKFVLSGFQSFQAISPLPCRPYSQNRDGINLGEAAAAMIVTKDKNLCDENSFYILSDSSINDANHISGPSRTGEGLFRSVQNALVEGNLTANDIDYISAHGTATEYNDEMEAQAFIRAGLEETPVASLKGCFGHTLGAAGLLETIISLRFASKGIMLPSFGFDTFGLSTPLNIVKKLKEAEIKTFLKTASGFGGSNSAVIFKKREEK